MALNKSKIKKSLFDDDKPLAKKPIQTTTQKLAETQSSQAKFLSYDVTLTVRLDDTQLETVEQIVKKIMKNRTNKKERITKNSIFRCLADIIAVMPIDLNNIPDEDELRRRMFAAIGMS